MHFAENQGEDDTKIQKSIIELSEFHPKHKKNTKNKIKKAIYKYKTKK
jgi:hypothetical protein